MSSALELGHLVDRGLFHHNSGLIGLDPDISVVSGKHGWIGKADVDNPA